MKNRRPLAILAAPLLAVMLLNQPSVSFASPIKEQIATVLTEVSSSSITLNWDANGTKSKVYKDGILLGETKENKFIDNAVNSNELYKYVIAVYDGDKLIDTFRISTKAKESLSSLSLQNDSKNNEVDMTIESVAGSNFVTLKWPEIPDDDGTYEVYKDGILINNVTGTQFIDENVAPNTEYRYNVIGKKSLTQEEISEIKQGLEENKADSISEEDLLSLENTFEAIKFVKTLDSDLQTNLGEKQLKESNSITLNAAAPYFSFRYLTFIPPYKVSNPFNSGTYFLGNNRTFNVLSNEYKTLQNVDVTFDQPSYSTYGHRTNVGVTYLVDENNKILSSKTAQCTTTNGAYDLFLLSPNSYGIDKKQFGAGGDCGIPYYDNISPDITYYYDAWIERDGDWRVKGSHDKAPAHEFYIYDRSTGNYKTIFQHEFDGNFNHLFPFYPSWSFDISG